ncbi:MAG: transporter [Glaciihabitans sp.]|nr:transporter [Glaciihabitans sp.]
MPTITRRAPAVTFFVLALGGASFSLLQSLLNPVLPTIQRDLHTDQSTVSWVLIAWILSAAIATPLLGRLGDMIGKKRTFVLALSAVVLGSVLAALSPTIGVLILARVLQGLGGAVFPLSFGIIRDEFPGERVATAVGAMSAVIAVGSGVGVVLAGPIVAALDWRWLFWIPAIVSTITAALAHFIVPESPVRPGGRINWTAATLLAGWLVALLLPLSEASQWGWSSPLTISLLVLSAVLLAAWIAFEARSSNPVIDMRMMRRPAVWTVNLVALFFGGTMFAIFAFLPQFSQTPTSAGYGFGVNITGAGLLMLPMLVTMAIGGFVSGPLSKRIGFKTQLAVGASLVAVSALALAFFNTEAWQVALEAGVFGLGIGFVYSSMTSLIVQAVPSGQTGAASGMNANIRNIGGAIGTAVMTTIVTSHPQASGLPTASAYSTAFLVMGLIAVVAVAVSAAVPSANRVARVSRLELATQS